MSIFQFYIRLWMFFDDKVMEMQVAIMKELQEWANGKSKNKLHLNMSISKSMVFHMPLDYYMCKHSNLNSFSIYNI